MREMLRQGERGIALIAALMIMLLMSALMIAFTTIVMSDQRSRGIDKDRNRAYYGAQSGLEKLTVDLGNLFLTNVAPTNAQIADLANHPPSIPGVSYAATSGETPYGVTLVPCDNAGNTSCSSTIQNGPYQGLIALKRIYNLDAVARTASSGETHLIRKIESVSIPVFQFGMFSDVDLSFFAGPNFNFGGRVHTNGNLFLAEGPGNTLTLTDKVTAVKEVVRQQLANGASILTSATHDGPISMATAPNTFRLLQPGEGSVTLGPGSAANTNWHTISLTTYNGYIRNGATGAKSLNLPLITMGGANTDLVRRPIVAEDVNNPVLFGERMFTKASVRIMLSDTAAEINNLPTVTPAAPVRLGDDNGLLTRDWSVLGNTPAGYGPVDATHPPIARSPGRWTMSTYASTAAAATTFSFQPGVIPLGGVSGFYNSPGNTGIGAAGAATIEVLVPQANPNPPVHLVYIDCQSITLNAFKTCRNHTANAALPNVAAGDLITLTAGGVPYTVTTSGAGLQAWGQTRDYTVTSANGTAAFATNTFWMQSTAAGQAWSLVTCTGVNSNTLPAPSAAPNNSGVYGGNVQWWQDCTGVPQTTAVWNVANTNVTSGAVVAQDTGTIGGFLKIEMQDTAGNWRDVTTEILNWGFADKNQTGGATLCDDPTPNAIIRLQRLRDNANNCYYSKAGANGVAVSTNSYDYWPNMLFDSREALFRDKAPVSQDLTLGGIIHYISLDVANLKKWFAGTAPYGLGSGVNAYSNNGYGVYFSDRRNNRDLNGLETGEYGFEDIVNPADSLGTPNGTLDGGEDVNANGVLDTYGQNPSFQGARNTLPSLPPGGEIAPFTNFGNAATIRPMTGMGRAAAMTSRPYLFRRALKMINGSLGNIPTPGLMVISENPIYVQGDWNANQATGFATSSAASCVIGDAVTLLSNSWTDVNSFANPYNSGNRSRAAASWYRLGIISGKGMAFPLPSSGNTASDFGTDGGAHNFLRMLEGNGGTVNYRGSIATFYYNRQAVGTYKGGVDSIVYTPPTRNFNFDTNFLNPATLCPLTPMFRDINALGFTQEMRPGR
jgi:hypothetical protein